jgi:hypothetical protein
VASDEVSPFENRNLLLKAAATFSVQEHVANFAELCSREHFHKTPRAPEAIVSIRETGMGPLRSDADSETHQYFNSGTSLAFFAKGISVTPSCTEAGQRTGPSCWLLFIRFGALPFSAEWIMNIARESRRIGFVPNLRVAWS